MGRTAQRYNKDQLLDLLQEACPNALASFPAPSTFKFQVVDERTYLYIGQAMGGNNLACGTAWVTNTGKCMPWLYVHNIYFGNMGRNDYSYVRCQGVFGAANASATLYAWSDYVKALVAFAFVYAGKAETFADFDYGKGLPIFVRALKEIAEYEIANGHGDDESENATGDENIQSATQEELTSTCETEAEVATSPLDADEDPTTCESGEETAASPSDSEEDAVKEFQESEISNSTLAGAGAKRALSTAVNDGVSAKKRRIE